MSTFNGYYEQELLNLRQLSKEFARRNPALAPLLGTDTASDPDVERLLEGVAFLTGLVRQRLDDEFPELIQEIAQLLYPQFLHPLPCMSILEFKPRGPLGDRLGIAAGCEVQSVPVDGEPTRFCTSFAVDIEPLRLETVRWDGGATQERSLLLEFAFDAIRASDWQGDRLRFYLGDGLAEASKLLRLLARNLREVRIGAAGQPLLLLGREALSMAGFDPALELMPYPATAHPAYRLLQEYFALPEKFLFVDLQGFSRWRARGESGRFSVRLMFDDLPDWTPAVSPQSLRLNVSPVVNLFRQDAHPLRIDQRQAEYRIQPADQSRCPALRIYSVDRVEGYLPGGKPRQYRPYTALEQGDGYHLRIRASLLDSQGFEHYLSLPVQDGRRSGESTLSIGLTCTHGNLPESLRLGDINQPSDHSPDRVSFSNIRSITPSQPPLFDDRLLWRVLSQLNANHLKLASREHLCELLSLYLPAQGAESDGAKRRRIESVVQVEAVDERRFVRGLPITGRAVRVMCRGDHFHGPGDLFLFGCVLDEFFAGCVAVNSFSALSLQDTVSGETLVWPAKTGRLCLL